MEWHFFIWEADEFGDVKGKGSQFLLRLYATLSVPE